MRIQLNILPDSSLVKNNQMCYLRVFIETSCIVLLTSAGMKGKLLV